MDDIFNISVSYIVTDPLIVAYLLHIYEYYHFYLKYYSDFNWASSVGTCIDCILIISRRALAREGDYEMMSVCACVRALVSHADFSKTTTATDFL